jgi:hypothetical protein
VTVPHVGLEVRRTTIDAIAGSDFVGAATTSLSVSTHVARMIHVDNWRRLGDSLAEPPSGFRHAMNAND